MRDGGQRDGGKWGHRAGLHGGCNPGLWQKGHGVRHQLTSALRERDLSKFLLSLGSHIFKSAKTPTPWGVCGPVRRDTSGMVSAMWRCYGQRGTSRPWLEDRVVLPAQGF